MEQDKKDPWVYKNANRDPLTADQVEKDAKERLSLINKEFSEGFEFIRKYPKSVTIFGSAVLTAASPYYAQAEILAAKLAKRGYAIVTGGGPGIMESANKGALGAGGQSIGLNIKLPKEQEPNSFLTDEYEFYYFFSRKVVLSFAAEAYIFFPGGFGTLNEFFEIVTLIQTRRIYSIPVILVGSDFWQPWVNLLKDELLQKYGTIKQEDLLIFSVIDNNEAIVKRVEEAPIIDSVPFRQR